MADDYEIFVLDRDAMMRLWLHDKIDRRIMSQLEADKLWRRYQTETKFVANYFSVLDDIALLTKLARDLKHPLARCYFKRYNGKLHIVFKGRAGIRTILTGTRYGVQNAKVINMGLGRAGVKASAKGGTIVSIFLLTAWNIADYVMRDEATLGQLIGSIAADVTKAALAGGVGYAMGAAMVGTAVGTFALGPLAVAVVVGIGVGVALDWLDNRYQLTQKLQAMVQDVLDRLQRGYQAARAQVDGKVEEARQGLLDTAADAIRWGAWKLIDMAGDAAEDAARRGIDRVLSWRFVPRF